MWLERLVGAAMNDWIIVTREQLYGMAWKKPMSQLAQDFGISGVGLAKLCSRHQIPTPPRGYWALLEVGRAPPKPALPAVTDPRPITIRRTPPPELRPEVEDALHASIKAEKTDAKRIVVGDRLSAAHPVVHAAKEALQAAEPDEIGILRPVECHAIRVSRAQRSRALRIFEALVTAFDERSWSVAMADGKVNVRVDNVPISFIVAEETEHVERQSKPDFSVSYSFHSQRHDREEKPCGRLAVEIEEGVRLFGSAIRRRWHDTEKHVLEDQLNDVVVGLLKLVHAVQEQLARKQREEQQERERARKIEEILAEQDGLRKLLTKEKSAVVRLRDQAVRWRESQTIRDFVARVRAEGRLREQSLEGQAMEDWCSWALQQADRLDPFAESPPSVLDRAEQIEHMSDEIPPWQRR
jgi:hypothetical protein